MTGKCNFYRCSICGNIVEHIIDGGGELVCCGQPMKLLVPNTVDASTEKHVPVVNKKDGVLQVKVGSVDHPMTKEHYIQFIYVCGETRKRRIDLTPEDKPGASFVIGDEKILAVYEYCNLHGLWVTENITEE